ncbi:MAG: PilZ domain-containing protein [Deltaproteobacteria bacterium]|nr:PilZ domain-containing protein [Deltaproteobacteria bacterium]
MSSCRKSPRVALDIFLNKFIEGTPFLCRSTDISAEGMYVGTLIEPTLDAANETEGGTVGLQFQLPGTEEVIYAEGEIIRSQQRKRAVGYGIKFTHLARRHQALIENYVRVRLAA